MTEREAATSALAGPLVNADATSSGPPPCAPTPGRSSTACGSSRRASATSRGKVAPTTAPTAESPRSPTSSSPHSRTRPATCCHRRVPSESVTSCTSAPPAFDVLTRQKIPAPVAAAGGEERLDRVATEIRVDGERVGERRLVSRGLEERGGVRARGRADVAALRVGDHEQPGRPCIGAHLLEGAGPVRPERLEERGLRLHRDGVRRDRVDDPAAEARARGGGVADGRARPRRAARAEAGRRPGRGRRRAGSACARRPRRAGRRSA